MDETRAFEQVTIPFTVAIDESVTTNLKQTNKATCNCGTRSTHFYLASTRHMYILTREISTKAGKSLLSTFSAQEVMQLFK
jgi:hypothetical protein